MWPTANFFYGISVLIFKKDVWEASFFMKVENISASLFIFAL